ncbi:MAG TPA: MmgE/PrpD family protein [Burkholderiales bacterium]|nr:MmgE/PrpD family protein [Burkholderiales bacterium]
MNDVANAVRAGEQAPRESLRTAVPLTQGLARFIAGLRYDAIPREAVAVIKTGFADCAGVMIAGSSEPVVRILRATLAPPAGESTLVFSEATAPAPEAAWINGAAAHALDYDDVAQRGHPSAVLVPAILAQGQAVGASGKDMITAYAAGYETWAELVRRDVGQHHQKGWHPTAIFGAIGAAAACASLLKLDAAKAAHAIALGASQSAGIMANFGTMTKPFHAGRSAHAGVVSARLAGAGFTASPDALEHPQGFLSAVSPAGRIDFHSAIEAGTNWKLVRDKLGVKKYPLCYCTHRALDAMLDLIEADQFVRPGKVARVTVSMSRHQATILRNHLPQTGLEAKFSMEFAMACALVARRASLAELQDDFVRRPDIQALMKRVVVEPTDEENPATPGKAFYDLVTVENTDGSRHESAKVSLIRGGAELPLKQEELWAKFQGCLTVGHGRMDARKLFDAFMALDALPHVDELPGLRGV